MTLFTSRFCVVDTETTGLLQDWSRVVELAGVILDVDGSEVSAFESLVIPDILDERAKEGLAINQLTPSQIYMFGHPTPIVAAAFVNWLQVFSCTQVTAFNTSFDQPHMERMGLDLQWAPCLMKRAAKAMGRKNRVSLAHATKTYGVTFQGDAHRALTDARAAADLVVAIQVAGIQQGAVAHA